MARPSKPPHEVSWLGLAVIALGVAMLAQVATLLWQPLTSPLRRDGLHAPPYIWRLSAGASGTAAANPARAP